MVFDSVCSKGTYQVNQDKFNNNDFRYSCRCCCHVKVGSIIICILQILLGLLELSYSIVILSRTTSGSGSSPVIPFIVVLRVVFPLLCVLAGIVALFGIFLSKPNLLLPQIVVLVLAVGAFLAELVWTGLTYPPEQVPFVVFLCLLYSVGMISFAWFVYIFVQCRCYLLDLINAGSFHDVQRYQPV